MMFGLFGSIAMQLVARLAIRSYTGDQLCPPSSVRHTPPPALPAHMVLGMVGCTTMARVRPPMLPGPSDVQPVCAGLSPAVGRMKGDINAAGATCCPVGTPAT